MTWPFWPCARWSVTDRLHLEVFRLLRESTGQDFSGYKISTIQRRLQRRMLFSRTPNLEAYVELLRADPKELHALHKDLLIGVTYFFRDADTFAFLKTEVFPALLAARAHEGGPRLWAAGCATGREAYSLAILLLEAAGGRLPAGARVFGTDIGEEYVETARAGAYPKQIADEVGQERLERFFTERPDGYAVGTEVHKVCSFASHDLTDEPPYADLDLISCRNVMIYFDTAQQRAVFARFHAALRPGGLLLLGRSESNLAAGRRFEPVDKSHRLYRKVEG